MTLSLMEALGSVTGKEEASQAANLEGLKKSDCPKTSYPNLVSDAMSGTNDPEASNTKTFPRRRLTLRRRASHRLSELYRLAEFYRQHGIRMDPDTWAFILAATLGAGQSAWLPTARAHRTIRWPGLTLDTLKDAIARCDLGSFDNEELETKINAVEQWQAEHGVHLMSMKRAGELLNLTAAEREACGIRTIDAVDETRAERKARLAEARKAADREAKRATRGRTPRQVYEAVSLSAKQPWNEAGVSRATWYRELKKTRETGVSARHISSSQQGQTHLSHDQNNQVAGPARTDCETLNVGAGVASPQGLPDDTGRNLSSNQTEDRACQSLPHPSLAHLPDPWLSATGTVIGPWWEPRSVKLKPGFAPNDFRAFPMSWCIPLPGRVLAFRPPAVETVTPDGLPICKLPPLHDGRGATFRRAA